MSASPSGSNERGQKIPSVYEVEIAEESEIKPEPRSPTPVSKTVSNSEVSASSPEQNNPEFSKKSESEVVKQESASEEQSLAQSECIEADINADIKVGEEGIKKEHHEISNDGNSSGDPGQNNQNKLKPTYPDGVLKTTARIKDGVSNSKYDPSVLPVTDDPKKIRAQVEFYFGDANLPTDKFMWGLTEGSSNKPVPIKKICEFGRMRRFSPYSAIVSALRESKFLKVSGDEGDEVVERKIPYDSSSSRSTVESRSIYAKGFGDEEPSSQFDIEAFFASYGSTNAVRLRRTPEKLFKGSVFVEFADEETAQKFLNLTSKPLWKGEHELKIMSKKAYTDLKMEEIRSGKIDPTGQEHRFQNRGRGRGRGNSRGNRGGRGNQSGRNSRQTGDRDPDNWKKRREDDRASGFKNDRNQNQGRKGSREKGRGRGEHREARKGRGNGSDRNTEIIKKEGEISLELNNDKSAENITPDKKDSEKSNLTEEERIPKAVQAEVLKQTDESSKKRSHEDDGDLEQGPNKKLDIKTEVSVEN